MRRFKLIAPQNTTLYNQVISKIINLFYDPVFTEQKGFFRFVNKGNITASNNYADFMSWPDNEISISSFLNITSISGDLEMIKFPSWITSTFIMYQDKNLWHKGVFSDITDSGFMVSGSVRQIIAPLELSYLGKDHIHDEQISFDNIGDYDISNVPGTGMEIET